MPEPFERDPLIQSAIPGPAKSEGDSRQIGPLDIPRSTRYGILAGIWAATFLSVSWVILAFKYILTVDTDFE